MRFIQLELELQSEEKKKKTHTHKIKVEERKTRSKQRTNTREQQNRKQLQSAHTYIHMYGLQWRADKGRKNAKNPKFCVYSSVCVCLFEQIKNEFFGRKNVFAPVFKKLPV